jgi:acyl-CoA oxidase
MTQIADRPTTTPAPEPSVSPSIDTAWLGEYLLGQWAEARHTSRALMALPEFQRQ